MGKHLLTCLLGLGLAFSTTSACAALADDDGDGVPSVWEAAFGLNPSAASDAVGDADSDGISNKNEFLLGSNPQVVDAGRLPDYPVYWDAIINNDWKDYSPNSSWQLHINASASEQTLIAADLKSTAVTPHSGLYSLAMEPARWRYLSLEHNNILLDAWQSLDFYVHGGTTGGQMLQVRTWGSSLSGTPQLRTVNVNNYLENGAVAAGEWRKVSIPLADLLDEGKVVSKLAIGGLSGAQPALYYLDDIRLVADSEPAPALQIDVDAASVSGDLPAGLFGVNGAFWMTNIHQDSVVDRVKALGSSVIRYPGGSSSDEFHWLTTNTNNVEWQTTPDEFLQLLQKSGAAGMVTANFGSGTAQEAADWAQDAKNKGANIPWWEIGNEVYGGWETSWTHDGTSYMQGDGTHDGANAYCTAIKAADPAAQVSMVGTITADEYNSFGPKALAAANSCLDYYTIHYYARGPGTLDYAGILSAPNADLPVIGSNVRNMLAASPNGKDLKIALTEYNSYYTEPEMLAVQTANMLFMADVVGQAAEQGVSVANAWSLGVTPDAPPNTRYGMLQQYLNLYRQPSYFAYPLWRKSGDQRLAATTNRFASRELSVYASKHSDSGDVTLIVINKSGKTQAGTINLASFDAAGTVEIYSAQGDSLDDGQISFNGNENPPGDLSQVLPIVLSGQGSHFTYSFAPYSVSSVTARAATGITLNISMLLQGGLDGAAMKTTLHQKGLIPEQQPYSRMPAFSHHAGNEQLSADVMQADGDDEPVDWVLVELRDVADPAQIVASRALILQRDGDVVDAVTGSGALLFAMPEGQYHVAVRHRNHLGVMTASPLALTATPVKIAFSDPNTPVWGSHARFGNGSVAALWAGDINQDGRIIAGGPDNDINSLLATVLTATENASWNSNFIASGYAHTDISMDGYSIFAGANNDSNLLIGNVLLHPDNAFTSRNFVMKGQLPE